MRDAARLFSLPDEARADVYLYGRWTGLAATRKTGLQAKVLEPPLVRSKMHRVFLMKST